MQLYRNFQPLDVAPANWTRALEALLSVASHQFVLRIKPGDATVLEVPASAGAGAVTLAIEGKPRWIEATVEYASPGGGTARDLDVWVVSTADVFTSGSPGETDDTDHAFTLVIKETGVPPTGVAIKRKVGTAHWDGTKFSTVTPTVGRPAPSTIGAAADNDSRLIPNLRASAGWDPPSMPNGAVEYVSVPLAGSAVGDFAVASWSAQFPEDGLFLTAQASINAVSVWLHNNSGTTVNLAPGSVRVIVLKALEE